MLKILSFIQLLTFLSLGSQAIAATNDLNVLWTNKKISITAHDVTLCEVLEEIGEKTNTKIRNNSKCDFIVNLNIEKASISDVFKTILKRENYVFVDNKSERKLLILNQKDTESGSSEVTRENRISTSNTSDIAEQTELQQQLYQDTSATANDTTATTYVNPNTAATETLAPLPYPAAPPFDPEIVEQALKEGLPPPVE